MKIAGVYKITNKITGDFYIGSSKNIENRWAQHRCSSMWKKQPNSKLYQDMVSYGLDNFKFEVLEETADLRNREQYWVDQLKPSYNVRRANGCDIERRKESHKRCSKEYHKAHRNERLTKMKAYSKAYYQDHRDECLAKMKDWHKANRDKQLAKYKAYRNRLCFYEGETLTLSALSNRFTRQGIANPCKEAKKYLL